MMKDLFFIVLFFSVSVGFSQQSANTLLSKYKATSSLLLSNKAKHDLNLDYFELDEAKFNENLLSQLRNKTNIQSARPVDNMPIFEPQGKFFLKIFKVDEDIDYKLQIFQFERSKYYVKSVG